MRTLYKCKKCGHEFWVWDDDMFYGADPFCIQCWSDDIEYVKSE